MRARSIAHLFSVVAIAAVAVIGSAASGHALVKRGDCGSGGYVGIGWTYYHYSGGVDYIDYYEYEQLFAGNKSNVTLYQSTGSVIYQWSSGDNLASDVVYRHYPTRTVAIPGSANTFTGYTFSFDRNNASDPSCIASTPTW